VPDIIIESDKRAHLSSIGLVSISPEACRFTAAGSCSLRSIRFSNNVHDGTTGSAKSAEMSYVLDELHKHFKCKIILVWDNLQGHKGLEAKYQREHPNWFHFERLPTYSPELNVVEQYWNKTKNVEMANFAPKNQKQVIQQVRLATKVINKNKKLLPNFLKLCKLKR